MHLEAAPSNIAPSNWPVYLSINASPHGYWKHNASLVCQWGASSGQTRRKTRSVVPQNELVSGVNWQNIEISGWFYLTCCQTVILSVPRLTNVFEAVAQRVVCCCLISGCAVRRSFFFLVLFFYFIQFFCSLDFWFKNKYKQQQNNPFQLKRRHDPWMPTRRGLEESDPLPAEPDNRTEPGAQCQRLPVRNKNYRQQGAFHRPLHHHPWKRARKVRISFWTDLWAVELFLVVYLQGRLVIKQAWYWGQFVIGLILWGTKYLDRIGIKPCLQTEIEP